MNVKKCIVLSRVSTVNQTLTQQTNEVKQEAKRLGYSDENIIVIEDVESAIKLDELERRGIQKLENSINSDPTIDCVVCYEVSRLSRRPKVLYSIRDFLLDRKIQLVILKPYLRLLDPDGSMSQSASIMFGLFSSISESEMMIKKERMLRGKLYKMQQGLHGHGRILFGYKVLQDKKNKKIEICPNASKIVKDIFNRYERGESILSIAKHYLGVGDIPSKNLVSASRFVGIVLRNEQYTGKVTKHHIYPQIISKEQFLRCREISKVREKPKSVFKSIYYCQGLLFDSSTSTKHRLSPNRPSCLYELHKNLVLSSHIDSKDRFCININLIDSIVWSLTKKYIKSTRCFNAEEEIYKIHDKQEILNKKIITLQSRIADYNIQIDRVENRIIQGKISEVKGDKRIHELSTQIADAEIEIDNIRYELTQLDNQVISYNYFLCDTNIDEYLDNISNDEDIYNLIHESVSSIHLKRVSRFLIDLLIIYKNGDQESYILNSHFRSRELRDSNNNVVEYEYKERFIRKKYSKITE